MLSTAATKPELIYVWTWLTSFCNGNSIDWKSKVIRTRSRSIVRPGDRGLSHASNKTRDSALEIFAVLDWLSAVYQHSPIEFRENSTSFRGPGGLKMALFWPYAIAIDWPLLDHVIGAVFFRRSCVCELMVLAVRWLAAIVKYALIVLFMNVRRPRFSGFSSYKITQKIHKVCCAAAANKIQHTIATGTFLHLVSMLHSICPHTGFIVC